MAHAAAVDAYLDAARKQGDIELRPCSLVSDEFQAIPPHRVGVAHLISKSRFLLGDPTGLGKTPQVLVAYAYVREQRPGMRLLVLCNKGAQLQWADEVNRFLPSIPVEVVGFRRQIGRKPEKLKPAARKQQWERFGRGEIGVLITTYHTMALDWRLPTGAPKDEPQWVWAFPQEWAPFILTLDEFHTLRSGKQTLLYPSAKALSQAAGAVWGLTATPLSNRLLDLWYLFNLLVPGLLGTQKSFEERFLNRRLKTIWVGRGKKRKVWETLPGGKDLPALAELMRPYTLKRAPEVLGKHMPSLMVLPRTVAMDEAQSALYAQILDQHFPRTTTSGTNQTLLKRQRIEAAKDAEIGMRAGGTDILAKAAALGYAQMALDAPEVLGHADVPSAKIDELLDLLTGELASEKVLVYTRYKQVAVAVAQRLKKAKLATGLITGDSSVIQRRDTQQAFQTTDALRVIVLNSAGRESLNLQAASVIVFLDLPWSWSEFIQVVGRARRFGSVHAQLRLILLGATTATNDTTIDAKTLKLLQNKAILVKGTFGLTLAESELTDANFDAETDLTSAPGSLINDLFADLFEDGDAEGESQFDLASV